MLKRNHSVYVVVLHININITFQLLRETATWKKVTPQLKRKPKM